VTLPPSVTLIPSDARDLLDKVRTHVEKILRVADVVVVPIYPPGTYASGIK
jgi:hypothetical protein